MLVDGGAERGPLDAAIAHTAVRSLPGLLGVDLGLGGALRVKGTQMESVGDEPISLFSTGSDGHKVHVEPRMQLAA